MSVYTREQFEADVQKKLDTPVKPIISSYDGIPMCPTCGEPTYQGVVEGNRCPFCNQLFEEPEEVEK